MLLDAILLDPYKDPNEIWFALNAHGSGCAADPYYGGVSETSPLVTSFSLVVGTDPRAIIAATVGPHGYEEGDIVVITGTSDLNGPYHVYVTGLPQNEFKLFLDFPASSSFSGTGFSVKRMFHLDQVLRNLTQSNVAIHFGPGVYETRGNAGSQNIATQGWRMRSGWKIRGSGIDVTTIKLASSRGAPGLVQYTTIGAQDYDQLADYSEVSDLTVDCNAQGN